MNSRCSASTAPPKFRGPRLTQSAAKEYACAGVTVNADCPGVVGTDMWVTINERFSEVTGAPKGHTYQQFVGGIAFGRAQTSADGRRLRVLPGRPGLELHDWAGRVDGGLVYRGHRKPATAAQDNRNPPGAPKSRRAPFGRDVPPSAAHQPPSHPAIRRLT